MNERQKNLLRILLESGTEYLSSQKIADQLECSEKTIRNDSKVLDEWLSKHSNGILSRKPNIGFRLEVTESDRNNLLQLLNDVDTLGLEVEDSERLVRILELLLIEKKPITIQKLSEWFYVNKAIVKKDLDQIESYLKNVGLTMVTKRKLGIEVDGPEQNWRLAISKIPAYIESSSNNKMDYWKRLFKQHELEVVQHSLEEINHTLANPYTDETLESLLSHILISVKRLKLGNAIPLHETEMKRIQKRNEYHLAEKTLKKLEPSFAVRFPSSEIAYIALHFMGGKVQHARIGEFPIDEEVHKLVLMLIYRVSSRTQIDFTQDADLLLGLNIHVQSTINRLKQKFTVSNPILDQIKRMYPYLFDTIISEIVHLNTELNLQIPEEESAYLTLHFQASLERMQKKDGSNKKAIIVCPMGIGASVLLRTKLERKFHSLDIIDTVSISKINQYSSHQIDFIITTVPITKTHVPVIEVTPLLSSDEEKKLQRFIDGLNLPITFQEAGTFPSLRALVKEELILIDLDFNHPYEVIEVLTLKLAAHGYVSEEYIESAIIREQHSSTNIGGGIAIPHGDPEYIKKSVIAVGILKKPLIWGKEYVSLVLALATKQEEHSKTRELFNEIGQLCDQPVLLNTLVKQTSPSEFINSL
ncbi:BglG family transcription antiterminator [Neobacillus sp. LXY-1]|uniref:BglG family transcription antiterminator n=1 Tax=Neobacillus sp. LXY-1 TaxID=3379133 RepID=UPI003EE24E60